MKSTVKKIGLLGIALIVAWSCQAVDYNQHFGRPARAYRVGLGSGEAPSAADMKGVGIRPGDIVINTDDDVLYIMNATNVYTKITAAGAATMPALTVTGAASLNGVTFNSSMITNTIASGQVLPAVDGSAITNMSAAQLAAATVLLAVDGSAVTNIGAANIAAASVLSAVDGSAVTNMAPATAFPDYGVVVVTNLDIDGTTNIITYIGTVSRNQ